MATIAAFALVITVLVFVHELGHFLAARWFGVPVEIFSIGFGPRLCSIRRSGIEYRISAIPFGGYVKMSGSSPKRGGNVPGGFESKSPWQRFVILLAGPVMNIAFAFVLATVALLAGIELPAYRSQEPVVSALVDGSAGERAAIQPGDRIVSVAGRPVASWAAVDSILSLHRGQNVPLVLRRTDADVSVVVRPQSEREHALRLGLLPRVHPVVQRVARGSSAERAGVRAGDAIESIAGRETTVTTDVAASVADVPGGTVPLTVVRNHHRFTVRVSGGEPFGAVTAIPTVLFRPKPLDALTLAVRSIVGSSVQILRTVAGLFTGAISPTALVGPVGLAQIAGESSQLGWRALLAAMAFISLNLGLCNLLPIPILDGGHMLMVAVEGVIRRDVPFAVRKALVGAGALAMLLLLVTTFYNDLGRLGWLPL